MMIDTVLKNYRDIIDKRINELFPESDASYSKVLKAARYSLLLGGKRIRPAIMIEFCKACAGKTENALDFSIALEMIHTYSLIHDDLPCMDNDDMRRGKPSCHKAFGEDIALLAGDTLLTEAFKIAANAQVLEERKIKCIEILASSAGADGMIGGQVLDLSFEKTVPTVDELKGMYMLKTGALLSAAAKIGCILGGADDETVAIAESYAQKVGLAFQIIDDILDVSGDEAVLGKPVGSDEANQKTTLVSLCGIESSRLLAKQLTKEAINQLELINGEVSVLKELTMFLLERNY